MDKDFPLETFFLLRPRMKLAARALVAANQDRGRTFDNSPDESETFKIIMHYLTTPSEIEQERNSAEIAFNSQSETQEHNGFIRGWLARAQQGKP